MKLTAPTPSGRAGIYIAYDMNEKHFYADPETPFHVWVKERCPARGYRWVLRDARTWLGSHKDTAPSYKGARAVPTPFDGSLG